MVQVKVTKKNRILVSFIYSLFVFIPITILIMLFFGMDTLDLWYLDLGLYAFSYLIAFLWLLSRTILYDDKIIKVAKSRFKFNKTTLKISNIISLTEGVVEYFGFPTLLMIIETRSSLEIHLRANLYDYQERISMYIYLKSINPAIEITDSF